MAESFDQSNTCYDGPIPDPVLRVRLWPSVLSHTQILSQPRKRLLLKSKAKSPEYWKARISEFLDACEGWVGVWCENDWANLTSQQRESLTQKLKLENMNMLVTHGNPLKITDVQQGIIQLVTIAMAFFIRGIVKNTFYRPFITFGTKSNSAHTNGLPENLENCLKWLAGNADLTG